MFDETGDFSAGGQQNGRVRESVFGASTSAFLGDFLIKTTRYLLSEISGCFVFVDQTLRISNLRFLEGMMEIQRFIDKYRR
jgi:hypothetical protein